jgi:glycerol-3-phosphate dehydrogenase (NAD(P)+)
LAIVTVLGAGRMGTAFCTPLLERGHEVRLVGTHLDVAYIDALRSDGIHPGLGHPLPPGASFHQLDELAVALRGAEMLALGVSSAGLEWASRTLADCLRDPMPLIMVTKGLDWDGARFRLLPDILVEGLPQRIRAGMRPVAVTGPCVAGELIRRRDTSVVFTGRDPAAVKVWADAAATPYYHVWQSTEFVGCEACAALKNAFAVAVGFASGALEREGGEADGASLPQGVAAHNVEAAVFAQATFEMSGLVGLVGGDPLTAFGLVGVGDLLVTLHARSVRLGRLLGRGLTLQEAMQQMVGVTLEGIATIQTLADALRALDASGRTTPGQFPLMSHLVSVIGGAPVAIPFDRFFGGRGQPDVLTA